MTSAEMAESALRGLAKELGLPPLPVEQVVELAVVLVGKLGGKSWGDAVAAGQAASDRIRTEDDAERSRRERMSGR